MNSQLLKISYLIGLLILVFSCTFDNKANNSGIRNGLENEHTKKEVVIFVYHRFGNAKYPSTNISLQDFEKHLSYLKSNHFKVLTFGKAVDYINDPSIPLYEKVACITVDDGYKTFKSNAIPLLDKYGFKATLFINSESVGGGSFMNWEDLAEVKNHGIEIGNHSHSHAYFLNLQKSQRINFFKQDLKLCQEEIKKHLGFYPDVFAYPYGEYDLPMKGVLKELGFKAGAAQNSGVYYFHDNYSIPRFPMAGPYSKIEGFIEKANMKALRIKSKKPESPLLENHNPPTLIIEFDSTGADLSRYNCFTTGECQSTISGYTLTIKAKNNLSNRRTLYKITAPGKEGKEWYWFSHLWIQPSIEE